MTRIIIPNQDDERVQRVRGEAVIEVPGQEVRAVEKRKVPVLIEQRVPIQIGQEVQEADQETLHRRREEGKGAGRYGRRSCLRYSLY